MKKTFLHRLLVLVMLCIVGTVSSFATDYLSYVRIGGCENATLSSKKKKNEQKARDRASDGGCTLVASDSSNPQDFNGAGKGGYWVYVGYKTSTSASSAITGLLIVSGESYLTDDYYEGHTKYISLNGRKYYRAPASGTADFNAGSGGDYLTLFYTKDGGLSASPFTSIKGTSTTGTSGYVYAPLYKNGGIINAYGDTDYGVSTNNHYYIMGTTHTHSIVSTFNWATDGKTCTVTFKCSACDAASETYTCSVTSAKNTDATCGAKGTTKYTATYTFNGKTYTDTKIVADIARPAHTYNSDKSYCTVCGHGFVYYTATSRATPNLTYGNFGADYSDDLSEYSNGEGCLEFTGKVTCIPQKCFKEESTESHKLTSVTIPSTVTVLKSECFNNCYLLTKASIPNSVKEFEDNVFKDCTGLKGTFVLPSSLEALGAGAFMNARGISTFELHSIPSIGGANTFYMYNSTPTLTMSLTDDSYVYTGTVKYALSLSSAPTYTRTMTSKWESLVLPFEINITGSESFKVYNASAVGLCVGSPVTGKISAGTPIIIYTDESNLPCTVSLTATGTSTNTALSTQTTYNGLSLTGVYSATDLSGKSGYVLEGGQFVKIANATNKSVNTFHAYLAGSTDASTLAILPGHSYTFKDGDNGFEKCQNYCGTEFYQPATLNDGYYEIGNAGQLCWFANLVLGTNNDGTYGNNQANGRLTADIDMGNRSNEWDSFSLNGIFDGNNHTISGLKRSGYGMGLVYFNYGTIKNLGISDSHFSYIAGGAICSYNEGTITNCYVSDDCIVDGCPDNLGGVCGINEGTITNCYSLASIISTDETFGIVDLDNNVGGVCGSNNGTVTNCYTIMDPGVGGGTKATLDQFKSGEVAYLLNNGNTTNPIFRQNVDVDLTTADYPTFSTDQAIVRKLNGQYANNYIYTTATKVGKYYYTSLYTDFNYTTDQPVYTATADLENNTMSLSRANSNTATAINSNTGVIIRGNAEKVKLTYSDLSSANMSSALTGSFEDKTASATDLVFSKYQGMLGFYSWTGNTIPAYKAYFTMPSSSAKQGFRLVFDDDDETATGINSIGNGEFTIGNYFNLQGQKVNAPRHGVYIKNGTKVVIK